MQVRAARGACCERFSVLPRGVLRGAVPCETSTSGGARSSSPGPTLQQMSGGKADTWPWLDRSGLGWTERCGTCK